MERRGSRGGEGKGQGRGVELQLPKEVAGVGSAKAKM